jgi:Kef-type K+ transport system membrane component KefB
MNRIEFIGQSIFIPFFLISVGMLVDIKVLLNGPAAVIIAVTLSVVALIGKWLAATTMSYAYRYTTDQRRLIFGLSSSHAAATLAVILVGFQTRIIDEKRGSNGFGYDPIFLVPELNKTAAELPADIKNKISHRGQAFAKLKKELLNISN